ncbi:hypothetical protein AGR4C_Lc100028 [Agrobacterium tumefaciens str. Kerr 14]|uniref:Uncharacterized protein n=1 Tax=Agrobacterium tumefaciens str. Kerr 14 TaxID=1183424 RepID=A0A1S7R2Y9_AGRTU|nr:hypothetical protein AGR4C_Lc100028 [Agrobacterium tumefaciens str. Kerr 14]
MPGTCPVKETGKGGRVVTLIKRKGSYAFENVQVKIRRHGSRCRIGGRHRKSGFCR